MSVVLRSTSLALAVSVLAACSGSSSLTDPTPPSLASGSATVAGLVEGGGTAAAADVEAAGFGGLRVSALGTAATTVTDAAGKFVLGALPAGEVTLRFEGAGTDARLVVGGLVDGQVVTITVQVTGHEARIMPPHAEPSPPPETEAHVRGKVDSVTPLRVAGTKVRVDGHTRWQWSDGSAMSHSDLKVGQVAEVDGTREADGALRARRFVVDCNS